MQTGLSEFRILQNHGYVHCLLGFGLLQNHSYKQFSHNNHGLREFGTHGNSDADQLVGNCIKSEVQFLQSLLAEVKDL